MDQGLESLNSNTIPVIHLNTTDDTSRLASEEPEKDAQKNHRKMLLNHRATEEEQLINQIFDLMI